MFLMYLTMTMMMLFSMILMFICMLISNKSQISREKMSPFECGFDPKSSTRMPMSSQFFLIAVLFLIFDIEIVIILPMIVTLKTSNMTSWFITSLTFIFILMIGLYHEWKNGILEWSN
uniref:NADH-ubiquinone oxidoreductase chain 3 n=1 Tax=Lasiolabops cosmopolites TaxID=2813038 RepID=A0A8T9ZXV3_9HEMI|nr:NADH dehydrogenase subunit 3 [Lasiolabops cosmopolites]